MTLSNIDLINRNIYLEKSGSLADRIDFAWETYISDLEKENLKEAALNFLIYALDIRNTANINDQLIQIMDERNRYKAKNPEFIPNKSPSRLPFDSKEVIVKRTPIYGLTNSVEINLAIKKRELLDVNNQSKILDIQLNTKFLGTQNRAKYRVHISGGLFKKNGGICNTSKMVSHDKHGFAAYTINVNGEISIFNHKGMEDKFAHSSMNAGSPVFAAGEIKIEKGVLKAITTHSGHYRPSLFDVYRTLEYFSLNNIDITQAKVITFKDPSKDLNDVSSKAVYYDSYQSNMYETPASEIYIQMKHLLNKNIDSINSQLSTYLKGGVLTSIYHLKDKLIGSDLTQKRVALAATFAKEVELFKADLKDINSDNVPYKMAELAKLMSGFQKGNEAISSNANKTTSGGRLANLVSHFSDKLSELKKLADKQQDRANDNDQDRYLKRMKYLS